MVPVAAFAGPDQNPLDCEYVTQTPRIDRVDVLSNGVGGGPYVDDATAGRTILIKSMREVWVPNPAYGGVGSGTDKTILRDYGFGNKKKCSTNSNQTACNDGDGTVTIGGVPINITGWDTNTITGTIPVGMTTGELVVTRTSKQGGLSTVTGLTVQVGLRAGSTVLVVDNGGATGNNATHTTIQAAIDDALDNSLILVAPGTYDELVIMWKPVQLQGWGEGSTTINAIKTPFNKLSEWRILAESLLNNKLVDLIPAAQAARDFSRSAWSSTSHSSPVPAIRATATASST